VDRSRETASPSLRREKNESPTHDYLKPFPALKKEDNDNATVKFRLEAPKPQRETPQASTRGANKKSKQEQSSLFETPPRPEGKLASKSNKTAIILTAVPRKKDLLPEEHANNVGKSKKKVTANIKTPSKAKKETRASKKHNTILYLYGSDDDDETIVPHSFNMNMNNMHDIMTPDHHKNRADSRVLQQRQRTGRKSTKEKRSHASSNERRLMSSSSIHLKL
jgi:hypothetical protein